MEVLFGIACILWLLIQIATLILLHHFRYKGKGRSTESKPDIDPRD
jgi:hypothetical protein